MSGQPEKETLEYFIDEAGSIALFDRRGKKIIVGQEGCSKFFMLGKVRVADPGLLRIELHLSLIHI